MATIYKVRLVCETDPVHYWREDQTDTVDDTISCGDHPSNDTRDFVIEDTEIT